jgi:hypothetical protein
MFWSLSQSTGSKNKTHNLWFLPTLTIKAERIHHLQIYKNNGYQRNADPFHLEDNS